MAYKLIYNPLIDYIRSHVRLCAVMISSKASMQLLLVNNWVVYCGMQAKSVCICTYDESKQCRLCDVKCIESDSHSANCTSFMLGTIMLRFILK